MADDDDPKAGELVTANYGWTKPTVGASDDQWGGYLNADLDGIDSVVHGIDTRPAYVLPVASTTVLGGVKVDGTTIQAAADGTISAPIFMGDNRIINGDMRIDQRNNGASGTAAGYTVDRWAYSSNQTSKGNWQRNPNQGTLPPFPYGLLFTSTSAYTPLAADFFQLYQPIEADMVSDFAWGTPQAQPVTLSFWAYSTLTGVFSGAINNVSTRSFPFTFSIPTASTWTKIVLTIPGDTGGTWVMSGNSTAMNVVFDLGSGANYRGAANAWASAALLGVTGAVRIVSTNAVNFLVTGIKLEVGSVATPYNRQSLAKSMADCQRYYQVCCAHAILTAPSAGAYLGSNVNFSTLMRANPASPTLIVLGGDVNVNPVNVDIITNFGCRAYSTAIAAGQANFSRQLQLNAEL